MRQPWASLFGLLTSSPTLQGEPSSINFKRKTSKRLTGSGMPHSAASYRNLGAPGTHGAKTAHDGLPTWITVLNPLFHPPPTASYGSDPPTGGPSRPQFPPRGILNPAPVFADGEVKVPGKEAWRNVAENMNPGPGVRLPSPTRKPQYFGPAGTAPSDFPTGHIKNYIHQVWSTRRTSIAGIVNEGLTQCGLCVAAKGGGQAGPRGHRHQPAGV